MNQFLAIARGIGAGALPSRPLITAHLPPIALLRLTPAGCDLINHEAQLSACRGVGKCDWFTAIRTGEANNAYA
jgi:hypothetical protein